MKKKFYLLAAVLLFLQTAKAQDTIAVAPYYDKEFKWTINIPEGFKQVAKEDWSKIQGKGTAAIEKTVGMEIENSSKTIFVLQNGKLNYLESSYQAFDPSVDGNFAAGLKSSQELLYQTFKQQMPGVTIKHSSSTEKIDGLVFYLTQLDVTYPNKMVLHAYMFNRLFGKREFTANIMFIDDAKGDAMLKSWRGSKFGKK